MRSVAARESCLEDMSASALTGYPGCFQLIRQSWIPAPHTDLMYDDSEQSAELKIEEIEEIQEKTVIQRQTGSSSEI